MSTADPQAIEGLIERVDYPLYVVTTAGDGEVSGCVAGFVTQCSIQPPRMLVCISKQNHTFRVAEQAEGLALHLLGADQHELASLFGERSGDTVDKLSRAHWRPGGTGAPILAECSAWVEGRILWHASTGDHEAFVMTIDDGGLGGRAGQLTLRAASDLDAGHPATDAATYETTSGPDQPGGPRST